MESRRRDVKGLELTSELTMNIERRYGRSTVPSPEEFEEHFRQAFGREMTPDERRYFFLGTAAKEDARETRRTVFTAS